MIKEGSKRCQVKRIPPASSGIENGEGTQGPLKAGTGPQLIDGKNMQFYNL